MGEIVLQHRAYDLCPTCRVGHFPVDAALRFSARRLTLAAEEIATLAGTVGSFAEAAASFLPKMSGLRLSEASAAAREEHRLVSGYVRTNLQRMDYPHYRREGWQIGSGHIEAACKTVVNQRLKQSGMRWGCDGADAVCHLRALYESEKSQWDEFWARSIN